MADCVWKPVSAQPVKWCHRHVPACCDLSLDTSKSGKDRTNHGERTGMLAKWWPFSTSLWSHYCWAQMLSLALLTHTWNPASLWQPPGPSLCSGPPSGPPAYVQLLPLISPSHCGYTGPCAILETLCLACSTLSSCCSLQLSSPFPFSFGHSSSHSSRAAYLPPLWCLCIFIFLLYSPPQCSTVTGHFWLFYLYC